MNQPNQPITILVADDDPDDRMLIQEALEEIDVPVDPYFVHDGEELLDYLNQRGQYANGTSSPHPGLILLDLNMPRKDGREALEEIKSDPKLRRIPVVVLTTSSSDEDINCTYDLGGNSFIVKPISFDALVDAMGALSKYWSEVVHLPRKNNGA